MGVSLYVTKGEALQEMGDGTQRAIRINLPCPHTVSMSYSTMQAIAGAALANGFPVGSMEREDYYVSVRGAENLLAFAGALSRSIQRGLPPWLTGGRESFVTAVIDACRWGAGYEKMSNAGMEHPGDPVWITLV